MLDRTVGPFFWGKLVSSCGIWIHSVAAALVAYDLTGSALVVGLVTAAQFGPQLLLAPLAGRMADAGNGPVQISVGRFVTGLASLGLAVWIWIAGGTENLPGVAPVLASSLLVGVGLAIGGPAMQSVVPRLCRPPELASAIALNNVPMTVARAVGPAVAVWTAGQFGPAAAFTTAGVANVFYGLVVVWLRLPSDLGRGDQTDRSIRAAVRYVGSDRALLALLVGVAAVGVGAEPSITLAPALAAHLESGAWLVGWLASSFGVGAGLGFILFAPAHRRMGLAWTAWAGLVLLALGWVIAAGLSVTWVAVAAFAVSGVGMSLAINSLTTQIQEIAPPRMLGRVMALWFVGYLGARPFAAALIGFLTDAFSVTVALLATAILTLAGAALCWPPRMQRRRRAPSTR